MATIRSRRVCACYCITIITSITLIAFAIDANRNNAMAASSTDTVAVPVQFLNELWWNADTNDKDEHVVAGVDVLDIEMPDLPEGVGFAAGGQGTYEPSGHLGMYINSASPGASGWGGTGEYSRISSKGVGATDTAGGLAPGYTASSNDTRGSGGIFGTIDATRFFGLPASQSLFLTGFFDYQRDNATFGFVTAAGAPFTPNAGSLQSDTYTLGGSLFYRAGTTYLRGEADYNFGQNNETNSLLGRTGSFNSNGYSVDAKLGNVFVLLNTTGASGATAMPTKAPPKPTGGYLVGLDLSGHLGYSENGTDGFTDTGGFIYGTAQVRAGDIGGRAELFALLPSNGLVWKPYIAGTVDQIFGFSGNLNIPSQAPLPGGDVVSLQPAQTFGGGELGLDARGPGGWTVGVKGFYEASADTNISGGSATLKIPFNYTATVASRY
jgi:hypothetical protein